MYSALIFKEWLKTRRVFFVALVAALLVAGYVILTINSLIASRGVGQIWMAMILKDVSMVDALKFVPLAIGIALGVAQMAPEMTQKRLKLTLHLPYPQLKLVTLMLTAGMLELLVIFLLQATAIVIYDSTILPCELVGRVMITILPWYFAGFIGYLIVSAVCLEGTWFMRIILSLIGVATVMLMFLQSGVMGAYNGMLLIAIVLILVLAILSFGSVARFKEGLQD